MHSLFVEACVESTKSEQPSSDVLSSSLYAVEGGERGCGCSVLSVTVLQQAG